MSHLDDDSTPHDLPVDQPTVTEAPLPQSTDGDAVDANDAGPQPADPAADPKIINSPTPEHADTVTDGPEQDETEPSSSSSSSAGEATSCSSDDEDEENASEGHDTLLTVLEDSEGDCVDNDVKNDNADEQQPPVDSGAGIEECPVVEQDPSPVEDDSPVEFVDDVEGVEIVDVVDGPENNESVDNSTEGTEEDTSDDVSPTDEPEEDSCDNANSADEPVEDISNNVTATDEDLSPNDNDADSGNESPPDDNADSEAVPAPLEEDEDKSPLEDDNDESHLRKKRYRYPDYLTTDGGGDASESSNMETATRLRKMPDDSASRKEWILRKESIEWTIQSLDKIMLQHGIEEVKAHFLWVYDRAMTVRANGNNLKRAESLSVCFLEADPDRTCSSSLF